MLIFLFLAIIPMLWGLGMGTIRIIRASQSKLIKGNILMPISLGCAILVCLLETLGLFLPTGVSCALIMTTGMIMLVWTWNDAKVYFFEAGVKGLFPLICLVVPIVMIGYPQLIKQELFIPISYNNDFAYYLSSVEWLRAHTILEPVIYSREFPFYSLAEYMIQTTRLGMDLTGSFVSCVFNLEAHEALSVVSVFSSLILYCNIYSVLFFFSRNRTGSLIFSLLVAVCGNTISLLSGSYFPQVFGIGYLVLALTAVFSMLKEKQYPASLLCGIFVSSTWAFYCEYTLYIVIISIVLFLFSLKSRERLIKHIFTAILCSAAMNIYAFYRMVIFNLSIFSRITENGASSIDPFLGNMLSFPKLIASVFGLNSFMNYDEGYTKIYLLIFAFISLLTLTFSVIYLIRQRKDQTVLFVGTCFITMIVLEIYFRTSGGAYQEFKHITSSFVFFLLPVGIYAGKLFEAENKMKIKRIIPVLMLCAAIPGTVISLLSYGDAVFTVDSNTAELHEIAELVPENEKIGIYMSEKEPNWVDYMSAIYALKDRAVSTDDNAAYYGFFQHFEKEQTRYAVYQQCDETEKMLAGDHIIWSNEKYILVDHKPEQNWKRLSICGDEWYHQGNACAYRDSDCIINDGTENCYMLYGPYMHMNSGIYGIRIEYTVIRNDGGAPIFDIYSDGKTWFSATLEGIGSGYSEYYDIPIEETSNMEFRVVSPAGTVLKLEGISILWQ